MSSLRTKVVNSAFWVITSKFGTQAVNFVVALILARLLSPSDYGVVALLTVFSTVAGMLIDSGMGLALVQKKDATQLDFNSLFYTNVALSCAAYATLFFWAPYVARYYNSPEMLPMMRVMSLTLVFGSLNTVQNAEIRRKFKFKHAFFCSMIGCLTSAVSGVLLAYLGYGPWAIVGQSIITGVVGVVSAWLIIAWRPRLMYSFRSIRGLFNYGWKVALVGAVDSLFKNGYSMIIGKAYTKEDLAFVNKGQSLPGLAMGTISSTITSVSFPAIAQMQDNAAQVKCAVRKMLLCATYLVFPVMALVGVCADDIVRLLFTEKWLPCVPYMRLACFYMALNPFSDINRQTIAALGKSNLFLRMQIILTGISVVILIVFIRQSVYAFMFMMALGMGPISCIINAWHNHRLINYSWFEQIKDIASNIALTVVMGVAVFLVRCAMDDGQNTMLSLIVKLTAQGGVGALVYFSGSWILRSQPMYEYLKIAFDKMKFISDAKRNAALDHFLKEED